MKWDELFPRPVVKCGRYSVPTPRMIEILEEWFKGPMTEYPPFPRTPGGHGMKVKIIKLLKDHNIIRRVGSPTGGSWELVDQIKGKVIQQRFKWDCSVCCTAMALGLTWEEVFDTSGKLTEGWSGEVYDRVFDTLGYNLNYQPRILRAREPAIIAVRSRLTDRFHAVYLNEDLMVVDPTVLAEPYTNLSETLRESIGFYQWSRL